MSGSLIAICLLAHSPGFAQTSVYDTLYSRKFKYEITVPGKPGIKDSVTTQHFYRGYDFLTWEGPYCKYYSSGAIYEKGTKVTGKEVGITTGFYPDGKIFWENFHPDISREPGHKHDRKYLMSDSIRGYYPNGNFHYKIFTTAGYAHHYADDSTGLDELLEWTLLTGGCKSYSEYYPDGSLKESGTIEPRCDTIDLNSTKKWKPMRGRKKCYPGTINHRDERIKNEWYPNGAIKTQAHYADDYPGDNLFYTFFQQWDSLGVLVIEGKCNGDPFRIHLKNARRNVGTAREEYDYYDPRQDEKGYEEKFIRYYPNGKKEWVMKGWRASSFLSLDLTDPQPEKFEGWETLIHFDEKGKIIRRWINRDE